MSVASVLGAFVLATVLAGCAPEPGPSAETDPPAPSPATPTPTSTTDPEDEDDAPSILQIPEVTDKEIARALFSLPDDTETPPNMGDTAIVAGEPLLLEGACVGETARYQITTGVAGDTDDSSDGSGEGGDAAEGDGAAEGDDAAGGDSADDAAESGEVLRTGILRCNEALYTELSLPVDGPVQISFVATDDIDEGWLVLTRTGEAE